ncbi:unnamed protein product [Amoebophrya sp. A25]|nr:unnamed protein product [Amoebophrya sp. A25]|eukprot:GSA25T00024690001.1
MQAAASAIGNAPKTDARSSSRTLSSTQRSTSGARIGELPAEACQPVRSESSSRTSAGSAFSCGLSDEAAASLKLLDISHTSSSSSTNKHQNRGWNYKSLKSMLGAALLGGWSALLPLVHAAVDEYGNVVDGGEMKIMMPPTPEGFNASEPDPEPPNQERILKLLMYELGQYNSFKIPRFVNFYEYEDFMDKDCPQKLVHMTKEFQEMSETVTQWHYNFTGTAGLFYLVQDKNAPGIDISWLWMAQHFQHRIWALINRFIAWIQVFSLSTSSHDPGCLYFAPGVRKIVVELLTHMKRLQTDNLALLWNGAAFGMLGDVTRDDFEEWELTEEEKVEFGVANKTREQILEDRKKPKSRFSQNLIFANMFTGGVSQWASFYAYKLTEEVQKILMKWDLVKEEIQIEAQAHDKVKSHHQNEHGMFLPYELWRREVFKQWAVDKGLLRGILKHVVDDLYAGRAIADFGAGGGHYARWINDTGLLTAYAYDGIQGVTDVTKGAVQYWNLVEEQDGHWREYDYGMCLEVLEHIPKEFSASVLTTISKYVRNRLIMSWSSDREGIGHVNCKTEDQWNPIVETFGWKVNKELTQTLREMASVEYISHSVTVFDKVVA